jgi:predicted sulfurtransferase
VAQGLRRTQHVVIDVRNFNESLIGKFAPPDNKTGTVDKNNLGLTGSSKVLDPGMRKSTDFPRWVDEHKGDLEGKKVLMYCTAGVRCERASAFIRKRLNRDEVYQLDGGIHRYLEEYKEDGGHWIGKELRLRQKVRARCR